MCVCECKRMSIWYANKDGIHTVRAFSNALRDRQSNDDDDVVENDATAAATAATPVVVD